MKYLKMSLVLITIHLSLLSFSQEDEHGHADEHSEEHEGESEAHENESNSFGKGKAIEAVKSKGAQFKLSPESEKTLGIKFNSISQEKEVGKFIVPNSSLVEFQDKKAVFIKREDWFYFIQIENIKEEASYLKIQSKEIKSTDQIVFEGVSLLRVAHMEASGQGGEGHAH